MDGQRVVAGSRGIVRVICGGDIFLSCFDFRFVALFVCFNRVGESGYGD